MLGPAKSRAFKFSAAAFIVSTGRTATQSIARYLDTYDDVTALHQPRPSRLFRIESAMAVCQKISTDTLKTRFLSRRQSLLSQIDTPLYVESNNYLFGFCEALEELFSHVAIIHITRHPLTFIESQLNFGGYRGLKRFFLDRVPYWTIKPEAFGNPDLHWRDLTPFEKYAWVWTVTNSHLDKTAHTAGVYERFQFEQLFGGDRSALQRLLQCLGLSCSDEQYQQFRNQRFNASRQKLVPPAAEWPASVRKNIVRICGAQADKYGYLVE